MKFYLQFTKIFNKLTYTFIFGSKSNCSFWNLRAIPLIPFVNYNYMLIISFAYIFFMLHINLTLQKQNHKIFENFVCKFESFRRTLTHMLQSNNNITNFYLRFAQ